MLPFQTSLMLPNTAPTPIDYWNDGWLDANDVNGDGLSESAQISSVGSKTQVGVWQTAQQ